MLDKLNHFDKEREDLWGKAFCFSDHYLQTGLTPYTRRFVLEGNRAGVKNTDLNVLQSEMLRIQMSWH